MTTSVLEMSRNLTADREMSGQSLKGKLYIAYFKLVASSMFSR